MKTYVFIISPTFPSYHPKAGQNTGFEQGVLSGDKIHTIRANYKYWAPRIKEVAEGKAVLSVRRWSGIPYNSKQIEIVQITKDNCPGTQFISMHKPNPDEIYWNIDDRRVKEQLGAVAKHDGLSLEDFRRWFFPKPNKKDILFEGAIIHFTKFRYK
jgi:hypothetical protein